MVDPAAIMVSSSLGLLPQAAQAQVLFLGEISLAVEISLGDLDPSMAGVVTTTEEVPTEEVATTEEVVVVGDPTSFPGMLNNTSNLLAK